MTQTGRCYCGDITYETHADPVWQAQCHCRECQYISGGGPNYFMMIPEDAFNYTKGIPQQFSRSDLETPRTRDFCGNCGTHLLTRLPGRPLLVLKVGTLDDPKAYTGPEMAIFTCDQQPFHVIAEGLPTADKLPPPRD
ncbi:GFA family protein [uncultured Sulfitobacter sp.]|uniref:GFA family protein n=1 Tax=uncultured Sulfitobacter sp. TaxID=191468 RepID=UPI00261D5E71|nr:GFA family protein [uncultured Sulfitobacter sp.]